MTPIIKNFKRYLLTTRTWNRLSEKSKRKIIEQLDTDITCPKCLGRMKLLESPSKTRALQRTQQLMESSIGQLGSDDDSGDKG